MKIEQIIINIEKENKKFKADVFIDNEKRMTFFEQNYPYLIDSVCDWLNSDRGEI